MTPESTTIDTPVTTRGFMPDIDYALRVIQGVLFGLNDNMLTAENIQPRGNEKRVVPTSVNEDDVYWVRYLTIAEQERQKVHKGGTHASPREHERRGHWRRNCNGIPRWIPSRVVNKGVGGKFTKDYTVRCKTESIGDDANNE